MAHGYPGMQTPPMRYPQAYHNFWQTVLVDNKRKSRQTLALAHSVRSALRAHAQRGGR